MRGRWGRKVARLAAASAAGMAACFVFATSAAAASTIELNQQLPTSPVQAAVGDVIRLTLPPLNAVAPSGYDGGGATPYPLPATSDNSVLPETGSTYDAGGTLHATFTAAQAGTATIFVGSPGATFCRTTTTSSTATMTATLSTSTATTTFSTTTVTFTTTSMATVTFSTTSVSFTTTTSTVPKQCVVADPLPRQTITVVVSAVGVQGANTGAVGVPSTGSHVAPGAGVSLVVAGVALVGVAAAAVCAAALIRRRAARRPRGQ